MLTTRLMLDAVMSVEPEGASKNYCCLKKKRTKNSMMNQRKKWNLSKEASQKRHWEDLWVLSTKQGLILVDVPALTYIVT